MTPRDDGPRDARGETESRARAHTAYFTADRGVRASMSVVETVAEATGTDPVDLRPIYEVVDPDALDALLDPPTWRSSGARRGHVTFRYEGCDVAVHADGRTVVVPAPDDEP